MEKAIILITIPKKPNDPTQFTSEWGEEAIRIAKDLGYKVIDIKEKETTYEYVTKAIKKYKPRLYSHFGHGCPLSLQGNYECIVTKNYSVDKLINMAENPYECEKLNKILNPIGKLKCPEVCSLDKDPCSPYCSYDTNINLLKDSIAYTVSCYSASHLGKCAINYGVETYIGYQDLLMFSVDSLNTQSIFGEIQLEFFKSLLMGNTVEEAEQDTIKLEDNYIRRYKTIKYIALPILWNKINRRIIGDKSAMIYEF